LGELILVGLGLHDEKGISLQGIEEARGADTVFAEFYTSLMAGLSLKGLEKLLGRRVSIVSRKALEEEEGRIILQRAKEGKVVLLVPGDPLIATTHVDLRIRAEREGVKTRVVHGASVLSAVIGLSGLQNYKYGRSVTVPFAEGTAMSETPYMVIKENKERGLHTLCFLDIRVEEGMYMTIREGLETLLATEKRKKLCVVTTDTLMIGIARAGSTNPIVKAGYVKEIMDNDFGCPPHSLIFPGRLHFMEAEALITLAGAPERIKEVIK
jgi:diphthine synthase